MLMHFCEIVNPRANLGLSPVILGQRGFCAGGSKLIPGPSCTLDSRAPASWRGAAKPFTALNIYNLPGKKQSSRRDISWSPNSTDWHFWYLCQQTNTKDIAGQSASVMSAFGVRLRPCLSHPFLWQNWQKYQQAPNFLYANWWRTDGELMRSWWRADEELMKSWRRADEELTKSWWRVDEELMKNLWWSDEELMKS